MCLLIEFAVDFSLATHQADTHIICGLFDRYLGGVTFDMTLRAAFHKHPTSLAQISSIVRVFHVCSLDSIVICV